MERLIEIGFKKAGKWILEQGTSINYIINEFSLCNNILYAFIHESQILYIGKSNRTLKERMTNYKNADSSQRTNVRIKEKIINLLSNNSLVEIYVFKNDGLLKYGSFSINLSAGLEDNIIEELNPEWNLL